MTAMLTPLGNPCDYNEHGCEICQDPVVHLGKLLYAIDALMEAHESAGLHSLNAGLLMLRKQIVASFAK